MLSIVGLLSTHSTEARTGLLPATNPTAVEGLDVNEVSDGLVVYDTSTERVHYLNHTAAFILQLCDGTKPPSELAALLATAFGLDQPPIAEVTACLRQLTDEGLVQ